MTNYINPAQLKEVVQHIKECIAGQSGTDIDLSKYDNLIKEDITLAELNAGAYHGNLKTTDGIRRVTNASGICGYSICITFTVYFVELYIGLTSSEPGTTDTLAAPKNTAYSKIPGVSLAFRSYVILNILDKNIITKTGLTDWQVMTLADVTGFKTGGSGEGNFWHGTQAEYDALTDKNPNIPYFITE